MVSAVIVTAGKGTRMNNSYNISKQHIEILGKSVIYRTVEKFVKNSRIDEIILVINKSEIEYFNENIINKFNDDRIKIVYGGSERFHSAYNGIISTNKNSDIVIIHDGVRPFVREKDINNVIDCAMVSGACVLAVKSKDTIRVDVNGKLSTTNRESSYCIQTPQAFNREWLISSYENYFNNFEDSDFLPTDDASILELSGHTINIAEGDYKNIKITTISDIAFAEAIINMEEQCIE